MEYHAIEKVKSIGLYGIFHFGETRRFDDNLFSINENIYQYRISKIKVFMGEEKRILGLQTFYRNRKGEEIPGAEGRDKNIKELDIKILEIPKNDYLCNLRIFIGDEYITKLIFITKKGKELIVGNDEGEERFLYQLNSKENIILSLSGGYYKYLGLISCKYLPIIYYLLPSLGYFELKKKLKNKCFKQKILNNYGNLCEEDKAIFKTCCLSNDIFKKVIKYCIY